MIFTTRIKIALIILLAIILTGTLGFHLIEGWSFVDSFYLCMATLSTVGYGDFVPVSIPGKIFAVFIIVVGVGMMFYTLVLLAETFIEGRLRYLLGGGKLEKLIEKLQNHFIICGGGRIGSLICRELTAEKIPCVLIDNNPVVIDKAKEQGFLYCKGDATQDKVLINAGIKRAKGVICVLPTDAQNLYVILTARELNQKIYILARSEEEESEHRLLRAGADRVMSPYQLGGMRMAMAVVRPAMLDFFEITTSRQSLELRMEEVSVGRSSRFVAKTLEASEIRKDYGLIIVAAKKETGKMIFNPAANYVIEEGDKLIAMGEDENVKKFAQACVS